MSQQSQLALTTWCQEESNILRRGIIYVTEYFTNILVDKVSLWILNESTTTRCHINMCSFVTIFFLGIVDFLMVLREAGRDTFFRGGVLKVSDLPDMLPSRVRFLVLKKQPVLFNFSQNLSFVFLVYGLR